MMIEKLTIGKKEFQVLIKELPQATLKFYEENPRVYSIVNATGYSPTQEEIESVMVNMDHVKELRNSIESNGGLIDPLIVRDGDFTVLEGNSRLAAYRILCQKKPIEWGMVKCKILPSDIDDSSIFALLGQYHIIGRKDWEPFEQANYLFRRHRETKIPIESMAIELGLTKSKAERMIEVIKHMIEHDDLDKRHWSYYEEYLKNASIKKIRQNNTGIDNVICESIKKGVIKEASDIRKLGEIAKLNDKHSNKIIQKIASGAIDIYKGYDDIKESGKLEDSLKKLKKFRLEIGDTSFEKQLISADLNHNDIKFEISKIVQRLTSIKKKIGE